MVVGTQRKTKSKVNNNKYIKQSKNGTHHLKFEFQI